MGSGVSHRQARHVRMYRWYLALTPAEHRARHGDDQALLFGDLLATGHHPLRLWIAAIADLISLYRSSERRTVMSDLARIALYPLSVLNALAGFVVVSVAAFTAAIPLWVAAPGAAVALQGVYSLLWLRRRVPLPTGVGVVVFAVGEAAALVTGAVGVTAAIISQSGGSDPEYGPPTLLALVAVHAVVGLLTADPAPPSNTSVVP